MIKRLAAVLPIFLGLSFAEEEKPAAKPEEKLTIVQIMNEAHEKGLLNRVRYDKATDEEKKRLLTLYLALQKQTPPQGDKEDWKELTQKAIDATQAVLDGKEGAARRIKIAVNCRNCHGLHKPD